MRRPIASACPVFRDGARCQNFVRLSSIAFRLNRKIFRFNDFDPAEDQRIVNVRDKIESGRLRDPSFFAELGKEVSI